MLFVGQSGTGTLNITNGGLVHAENGVRLATGAGSTGALNITGGSTLRASILNGGPGGTGQVNFDNATWIATTANTVSFIAGFTSTAQLNIAAGGLTVETDVNVGTATTVGFSGVGALTKTGSGTLTLRGASNFTGETTITAGTLALAQNGSLATSSRIIANGGFNISAVTPTNTRIQSLAGAGSVTLGAKTLIIHNANDAFSGIISGTGGLSLEGGTETLSGANSYTGPTSILGGALLVDGSIVSATTVAALGALGGTGTIANNVFNNGSVEPGFGLTAPGAHLTVNGNYVGGAGSRLALKTMLGADGSPTDQLIIGNGGLASGVTGITVTNVGGTGAQTIGLGIPVVVAQGGSTTDPGAFVLMGTVAAGPFQYLLFRGDTSAPISDPNTQNTWFLRSHCEGPECDQEPTPFYRPETSIYGSLPSMARSLGIASVSTFHERYGDQNAVRSGGGRAWGRVFGEHNEQGSGGDLNSRFEGWLGGVQLGVDAFRWRGDDGSQDTGGFFFTLAKADGDVNGFAIGVPNAYAGSSDLSGNSFGAYYTHIGQGSNWYGNWYIDGLAMQTFYGADGTSTNNVATNVGGSGTFLSLEGGVPIALGYGVSLEGQGQLIYQRLDFGGTTDPFSSVAFDTADVLTGRIGLRLAGEFGPAWRPYLKANLWNDWGGTDHTIYEGTSTLSSITDTTALELGGGLVGSVSETLSVWAVADYTRDVDGNDLEVIRGNLGVSVGW